MAKIVLFVDAMDKDDLTGRLTQTYRGQVPSGGPKVTPKVTGEVYTGSNPTEQGMGRAHALGGEQPGRAEDPVIMEKLEAAGYNVCSFWLPYALPLQLQSGAWISEAMGQKQAGQSPFAQLGQQVPTSGDLMDPEDDGSLAWNARTDEWFLRSSHLMQTLRHGQFDVAFVGVRSPDQYTHFQQDRPFRERIVEDIAHEINRWEVNHDVLWWSDHGNEPKEETFRVNAWLAEKGYLDIDVDVEFHARLTDVQQDAQPGGQQVENQIGLHSPSVEINGGLAASGDPYDSCLTFLGDPDQSEVDSMVSDLMDTGMYRWIKPTEEAWGTGRFIEECPDLIAHRADNVLVTGNVHPEPIGMGFHRSGVHSAEGVWGTTDDDFTVAAAHRVSPKRLHDVIWQFVTGESQVAAEVEQRLQQARQAMEAVGDG